MNFIKCNACPSQADCDEAGKCLNTLVTHSYILRHKNGAMAGVVVPEGTYVAQPSPSPAKAPPSAPSAPGQGSVTERIFAACDAVLAELHSSGRAGALAANGLLYAEARKLAIPRLEAQGVNSNSARKGSSMWIAARR